MNKKYPSTLSFLFCWIYFVSSSASLAQNNANGERKLPEYFHGITLENMNTPPRESKLTPKQVEALNRIRRVSVSVVVRLVFQKDTLAKDYAAALSELKTMPNVFVMGLFLDSEALKEYKLSDKLKKEFEARRLQGAAQYAEYCAAEKDRENKSYPKRINCFLDTLNDSIDVWEVGNEVNGDWADEGKTGKPEAGRTVEKIQYALAAVKAKNAVNPARKRAVALTLVHMPGCTKGGWEKNEMLVWARDNLERKIDGGDLDYLLVSYYEDNCDGGSTTTVVADAKKPQSGAKRRNLSFRRFGRNLSRREAFRIRRGRLFVGGQNLS